MFIVRHLLALGRLHRDLWEAILCPNRPAASALCAPTEPLNPVLAAGEEASENSESLETSLEPSQSQKFIEAARELGCAEDESAFDEMVKKVAKAPPPRQDDKPKAKKG